MWNGSKTTIYSMIVKVFNLVGVLNISLKRMCGFEHKATISKFCEQIVEYS